MHEYKKCSNSTSVSDAMRFTFLWELDAGINFAWVVHCIYFTDIVTGELKNSEKHFSGLHAPKMFESQNRTVFIQKLSTTNPEASHNAPQTDRISLRGN